eukprot:TRINITY_DN5887_c0_g1_i1.p1 TRINITY_DN5887_c0_g1~~TRINITY_DN5887_c0_g1_i1.p1  ORF type:complete len:983 (-),score=118.97 TRINITY_DN5887_c0_g1_i1:81-3029(-)
MEELERAVLCQFDPRLSSREVMLQAQLYTESIKASVGGWRLCFELMFKETAVPVVKIFAAQAITEVIVKRYDAVASDPTVTAQMREMMVKWMKVYLPYHPQEDNSARNKMAQAIAALFKKQYPQQWPTFFSDFSVAPLVADPLTALRTDEQRICVDMFLRIIKAIDEDVVSREVTRSTSELDQNGRIKDAMRSDCIPALVDTLYKIMINAKTACPQLVSVCLSVFCPYIDWIETNLVVNDQMITLLFECLTNELFRRDACECLCELIAKGMSPLHKMDIIVKLNLLGVLASLKTDDTKFKAKLSKLLGLVGEKLISGWTHIEELVKTGALPPQSDLQAKAFVDAALNLLWAYMADDEITSAATFEFAATYLNRLKQEPQLTAEHVENMGKLLTIIAKKMTFPDEFDFKHQDDPEIHFLRYRTELGILLRHALRVQTELVVQFVQLSLNNAISNIATLKWNDMELPINMLLALGEAKADLHNATHKPLEAFFSQSVLNLLAANVHKHSHRAVVIRTFECVSAYFRYLPAGPQIVPGILEAFISFGLRNPELDVRNRVSYLLMQFVKAKRSEIVPITTQLLVSLKDFLALVPQGQGKKILKFECQLYLFDAIGNLIGAAAPQDLVQYLEGLVRPLTADVNKIISTGLYRTDTTENPVYCTLLERLISALGCLSRGVTCDTEPLAKPFQEALVAVLTSAKALPHQAEIRTKVIFFIHQMIGVIGQYVLPYVPQILETFLAATVSSDVSVSIPAVIEVIQLTNQLITRFKDDLLPLLNQALIPMVQQIFKVLNSPVVPSSDDDIQMRILQRIYFVLIRRIAQTLPLVLTSEQNAPRLIDIIQSILLGCQSEDLRLVQLCFVILVQFIKLWYGSNPAAVIPGFNDLVYNHVIPPIYRRMLLPDFKPDQGVPGSICADVAAMHRTMLEKGGEEFEQYLQSTLLPSTLSCNAHNIELFITNLRAAQPKDWRQFFTEFIKHQRMVLSGTK